MKIKLSLLALVLLLLTSCGAGAPPAPTVDVNALNTAAVATAMGQLSAQFTQTALAAPTATATATQTNTAAAVGSPVGGSPVATSPLPTLSFNNTPVGSSVPGFTPIASSAAPSGPTAVLGDACNNSAFVADITIPDGTVLNPGADFQKVWALQNTGSCTWDEGYSLVYIGGSNPDLDPYTFEFKKSSDFVKSGETINIGINLTAPCTPGTYEGTWRMRSDSGYYFGTYLSVYVEVKDRCR